MKRIIFITLVVMLANSVLLAKDGPTKQDYDWWRKARFGIFIHWGPSSVLAQGGGSWQREDNFRDGKASSNSSTPGELPDEMKKPGWKSKYYGITCKVPQKIYDNLYQIHNPKEFNADEWAKTFHDAGANYIVFTTKHHDGFCNFDSSVTDYKITNTPFKRDICKELTDACRKYDIKVIWYYSKPDWYDPRYNPKNPKPYEDYMVKQIEELCTKYGEIKGFWWDGGNTVKVDGKRITDVIFKNQPGAIYNSRGGMSLPGVTFATPEQKLGEFNRGWPWESCVTMQGEGWFWNGGRNIMSANDCIKLLVNSAVGDGNLLLDFGPTEKGTIPDKIKDNYLAMGRWLKKYGESIYGTRGGPYKPGTWGGATCKGNNVYLHITEVWPSGKIVLPALPAKVISISALTGGKPKIRVSGKQWVITLEPKKHGNPDTIIKLKLDKDAVAMTPIDSEEVDFISLNAVASASSYRKGWNGYPGSVTMLDIESNIPAAKYFGEDSSAVKGKPEPNHKYKPTKDMLEKYPWIKMPRDHIWRFWMADPSEKQPWLELDFGKYKTFNKVTILEKFDRIKQFRLMYEHKGKWVKFYSGGALGSLSLALPKAIVARKVRIKILDWSSDDKGGGPGLREFDFWYDHNGATVHNK